MRRYDSEGFRQDLEDRIRERSLRWERRHRRRSPLGGIVFGTAVVAIGVLFLLQNLGVLYVDEVWQYWPVLLMAVGISHVVSREQWFGRFWGVMLTLLGGTLLAHNLGYLHGNPWNFVWPFLLIWFGVGMLIKSATRGRSWGPGDWRGPGGPPTATLGPNDSPSGGSGGSSSGGAGPGPNASGAGAGPGAARSGWTSGSGGGSMNHLNELAIFSGVRRRVESQEFEGGDVTAIFGGVELDLRGAATSRDRVFVEVTAVFGGVEIQVPENWTVRFEGAAVLGGYDDRTHPPAPASSGKRTELVLTGSAVLGGVNVRN